ncbi:hypothetical protein ACFQ6U_14150 [Streptomyces sp. NPDC056465]|uniref:hypothetical protein n=1 Tax=Streptomyces sp. NPDC056465 TaxID=3345829 RepID=UPI0036CD4A1C
MSTTARPATIVYGALAVNLAVPQVAAAIRVLSQACKPLAAFRGSNCIGNGAYLAPRVLSGTVVLTYRLEDSQARFACRATERAVAARILDDWADVFRASCWAVDRYVETDRYDGYRLVRLGLTPPAEAVPSRVLTPLEHHAAWHAIEGAAGEEGADPETILNAVLRALNITSPHGQ